MHRTKLVSIATPVIILLMTPLLGCREGNPEARPDYIVERSTQGDINTVRIVSGSLWGGEARLVEELAIGDETGEEPYLFGWITDAWATADRIYVVDGQAAIVRAFDSRGRYLFDVGRNGQGPGEYSTPMVLAVTSDGRVLVADVMGARLNIFDAEGASVDDWSLGSPQSALGLTLSYDDDVYTRIMEMPEDMATIFSVEPRLGMQAVGAEGLTDEPVFPPAIEFEPPTIRFEVMGNEMLLPIVPFTPSYEWTMGPGGEIIAGVGDEYRFTIRAADGSTTIVEKHWEPVSVPTGEAEFQAAIASADVRSLAPDFKMRRADVPSTKPAFDSFLADRSGRVWVIREGPGRRDPTCTDVSAGPGISLSMNFAGEVGGVSAAGGGDSRPDDYEGECWSATFAFDVFDLATGDFLGTVPAPEPSFGSPLFVEGDVVLGRVTDEQGTVRLKRYRLVVDEGP